VAIASLTLKQTNQTSFISIITKYIDKTVIIVIYTKLVISSLGLCFPKPFKVSAERMILERVQPLT